MEIKLDIKGYMQEQPQQFRHITKRLRKKSKNLPKAHKGNKKKEVSINHTTKLDTFRYLVGMAIIILPLAVPFGVLLLLTLKY